MDLYNNDGNGIETARMLQNVRNVGSNGKQRLLDGCCVMRSRKAEGKPLQAEVILDCVKPSEVSRDDVLAHLCEHGVIVNPAHWQLEGSVSRYRGVASRLIFEKRVPTPVC